jgi:hypothetical protein
MSEERSRILTMLAEGTITAEEAGRLLDALESRSQAQTGGAGPATGETAGSAAAATGAESEAAGRPPKYMYVKVVSVSGDNVDVRIPLNLVRSGLKLTSLIPPQAMEQINQSMSEHGMSFDLASFKPEDIEELIMALREMEVNVDSKNGDNVRVYCA